MPIRRWGRVPLSFCLLGCFSHLFRFLFCLGEKENKQEKQGGKNNQPVYTSTLNQHPLLSYENPIAEGKGGNLWNS